MHDFTLTFAAIQLKIYIENAINLFMVCLKCNGGHFVVSAWYMYIKPGTSISFQAYILYIWS